MSDIQQRAHRTFLYDKLHWTYRAYLPHKLKLSDKLLHPNML